MPKYSDKNFENQGFSQLFMKQVAMCYDGGNGVGRRVSSIKINVRLFWYCRLENLQGRMKWKIRVIGIFLTSSPYLIGIPENKKSPAMQGFKGVAREGIEPSTSGL
jgi:hypothetical protein